jgi:hypothetical protein
VVKHIYLLISSTKLELNLPETNTPDAAGCADTRNRRDKPGGIFMRLLPLNYRVLITKVAFNCCSAHSINILTMLSSALRS